MAEPTTRMDDEEGAIDARRCNELVVKERLVEGILVVVGWIWCWFDVAVIASIMINSNSQIIIININLVVLAGGCSEIQNEPQLLSAMG